MRAMRRGGFTLIELMIVVAIVGVLAALAIPSFLKYQLHAKSAEALTSLQAIAKAQESYFAEFSVYVSVPTPMPPAAPGAAKRAWAAGSNFDVLGWAPEGALYFQYLVTADDAGGGGGISRYTAEAGGDLDGDGAPSFFGYVKPAAGQASGLDGALPGSTCVGTGVFDPGSRSKNALSTPGACDSASGRSVF
jgi:type IV pilus assembly protein PilA